MLRKISLLVFGVLVCTVFLGMSACHKVDRSVSRGMLATEAQPFPDGIPAEYGELKGVTSGDPGWAVLVFEKPDKTIVMLGVRPYRGGLAETAVVIPRK